MTNPEPLIYNQLLSSFEEVSATAKKIGRLETINEVLQIIAALAKKSKSKIEIRTYEELISHLKEIKA